MSVSCVVCGDRKQVGSRLGVGPRPADGFAVAGERRAIPQRAGGPDPGRQCPLEFGDGEAGQQPAEERARRRMAPLVGRVARPQGALLLAPLPDRGERVTVAQQGGDQTGEREGRRAGHTGGPAAHADRARPRTLRAVGPGPRQRATLGAQR